MLDPSLTVAKENAHSTLKGLVGGAGLAGTLGVFALIAVAVLGWTVVRQQLAKRRLARLDPQLLKVFEHLEADKKAGRI